VLVAAFALWTLTFSWLAQGYRVSSPHTSWPPPIGR
jgi:hypothetical protein